MGSCRPFITRISPGPPHVCTRLPGCTVLPEMLEFTPLLLIGREVTSVRKVLY